MTCSLCWSTDRHHAWPAQVDLTKDRDALLHFHVLGNYHSDSPWASQEPFEEHLREWLRTSQTEVFLSSLARSMEDPKTITELWEDRGHAVGFLWVAFSEITDYSITVAEVNDLEVSPELWRRGIGTQMLERAERVARNHRTDLLRSETGVDNLASQKMHAQSTASRCTTCSTRSS